jgi:hypothetical protein
LFSRPGILALSFRIDLFGEGNLEKNNFAKFSSDLQQGK